MKEVVIIGAVGTASNIIEQIIDSAEQTHISLKGVLIDSFDIGSKIHGIKVIGGLNLINDLINETNYYFIFSLYKPDKMGERARLLKSLDIPKDRFINFIHPSVYIAKSVQLGVGNVFLSNSTIQSDVSVGDFNIINSNVSIEHDSKIGNSNFIAANSTIGANVSLVKTCFIGLNSSVRENTVLNNCFVGMHSLVISSYSDKTVFGVPSKALYMLIAQRANAILYQFIRYKNLDKRKVFLIPSNICQEVLLVLLKLRLKIKFLDLDQTFNNLELINKDKLKKGVYSGMIYNHCYGNEYTPFEQLKQYKELRDDFVIIDDRCLCMPDTIYNCKPFIDLVLFSTGEKKQVNLKSGGFGFSSDENFKLEYNEQFNIDSYKVSCLKIQNLPHEEINKIASSNWLDETVPQITDYNYISLIEKELNRSTVHKKNIISIYKGSIRQNLQMPKSFQNWRFNIIVRNKDEVLNALYRHETFASNHYYSLSGIYNKETPNAEFLYNHVINLFIDSYYSTELAKKTTEIINKTAIDIEQ